MSLAEILAIRSRWQAEQLRRDKELRYVLVAITGNKELLRDEPREHAGPGPKSENLTAPLDKAAMELSKRFAALGV